MALQSVLSPHLAMAESGWERAERLEAELAEARSLLLRLVAVEDRIGLVFTVTDDARSWLARTKPR